MPLIGQSQQKDSPQVGLQINSLIVKEALFIAILPHAFRLEREKKVIIIQSKKCNKIKLKYIQEDLEKIL